MSVTDIKAGGLRRALRSEGRSVAWLARTTGYSSGHIHNVLSGRAPWTPAFQAKVTEALGRDLMTLGLYRGQVIRIPENIYRSQADILGPALEDAWKEAWVKAHGSEALAKAAERAWQIAGGNHGT